MIGTTLITHKRGSPCPRVHNKLLYYWLFLQQGLTNPEYKSTQQDWPDEKGVKVLGMQVLGQGKDVARFKSSLPKAFYSWSYFQVLPLSTLVHYLKLSVHIPYSNPSHSIPFSHVLVIHQSCIASVMNRVSISAEHRQFELIQVPAGDSLSHDICRT